MKHHYLHYLQEVMKHQWGDTAVSDYGEKQAYTFGQMAEEVERLHVLFEKIGIKAGDKIAIASRNCANWVVAYLAIQTYKAVVVSILQDFKAEDIANLLRHSDAKLLFVGPYVWKDLQHQDLSQLTGVLSMEDFAFLRAQGA